jgi:hypothetical protein
VVADEHKTCAFQEYLVNSHSQELGFQGFHQPNGSSGLQNVAVSDPDITTLLDCHQFTLDEEFDPGHFVGTNDTKECGINSESNNLQYISPPPSAFMGPKCALWDCTRPAQGAEWCEDYCSSFHATLALNEGPPGMTPVLRPRGINLKDNLLFDALTAKMQGKNVGIPQCEGAAVMKSPWNAAGKSTSMPSPFLPLFKFQVQLLATLHISSPSCLLAFSNCE